MKVLQFGMTANRGGVESVVMNYAQSLQTRGVVFDYVDLQGVGLAGAEEIRQRGGTIFTLKKDHRKHPFLAAKQIEQIVREGGYRCAHINMLSAASPVAVVSCLRAGANVIMHAHNTRTVGLHRKILHTVNSVMLSRLPLIRLACSTNAGKWMFGDKAFTVIPNAIHVDKYRFDPEIRKTLRASLEIADETLVMGFVGRLAYQKNPTYLPQILHAVKKQLGPDVKLLIIGDGDLKHELLQVAAYQGVGEDIIFLGMRDNVAQWYSAMDVLVLPSLFEALPVVGVEAQAAGLPCFLSDRITEEIILTDLMHLCPLTDSADNWAEAIRVAIGVKPDRCRYADEMKQSNYSLERSSQLLWDLYTSCHDQE